MSYLSKEIQSALHDAHEVMQRKTTRLTLHVGKGVYPIARLWDTGFAIDRNVAPRLNGVVDLYDGPRYLSQCTITKCRDDRRERVYEYTWRVAALSAPPVDYIADDDDIAVMVRPD